MEIGIAQIPEHGDELTAVEGGVVHAVVDGLPDFVFERLARFDECVFEAGEQCFFVEGGYVVDEFLGLGEEEGLDMR